MSALIVLLVVAQTAPITETATPVPVASACASTDADALPIGPIALSYSTGDFSAGRRACGRTEVGLGVRGLGIIDTPNFYGNVGAQGVLFGSWAVTPKTELFASLEAVTFGFTQNATLTKTSATLGHLTAGIGQRIYETSTLAGTMTARLLFPTSFEIPGMRLLGAEVGHAVSYRPLSWLEVHGAAGIELTAAVGLGPSDPRVAGYAVAGAMWQPTNWFGVVLDLSGRVGRISSLSPIAGVRFRIKSFGIEVGGGLPIVGNDRHDFAGTARFSWRF